MGRGQRTESRGQKTEGRGKRTGRKTEDRNQRTGRKTEDRNQRSEVRRQETEIRGQRSEVGGRKTTAGKRAAGSVGRAGFRWMDGGAAALLAMTGGKDTPGALRIQGQDAQATYPFEITGRPRPPRRQIKE